MKNERVTGSLAFQSFTHRQQRATTQPLNPMECTRGPFLPSSEEQQERLMPISVTRTRILQCRGQKEKANNRLDIKDLFGLKAESSIQYNTTEQSYSRCLQRLNLVAESPQQAFVILILLRNEKSVSDKLTLELTS